MQINQTELIDILENQPHHSFISVITETNPVLNKIGRISKLPITIITNSDDICKRSEFVCGLGYDYVNVITTRLKKENKTIEEYERGESWHEAVIGTKNIRKHKKTGEYYIYLFMIANNIPKSIYFKKSTGEEINKALLEEYLQKKSNPSNQGLSDGNEVNVKTFKLNSIKKIKMNGEVFEIV